VKIFAHKYPLIIKAVKGPQDKLDIIDTTKLTAHHCNLLQDLCYILTPLEVATDYTQGKHIVTSSYVVPCEIGLKAALNNMHSRYNTGMVTALKKTMKK